jgi:penicillin-binding protein 2
MQPSSQAHRSRQGRSRVLVIPVLAGFGLIALGLIQLQVVEHDKYRALSKENSVRLEVLRAPRGAIFDRNGRLLADSAPSFSVVFRPFPVESVALARRVLGTEWIQRVANLIGANPNDVRRQVEAAGARGENAVLRRNAPFDVRAAVEETREDLPGIDVVVEPLRHYPHGTLAAHLLGYAGEINDIELDSLAASGYRPGDLIGRSGVERTYEEILRGQDGAEFVVVNAGGQRVSTLREGPPRLPVPGHDVVLTVDYKVQQALETAMANVARGAAVAIDPRDGGILGLVSRPAFDPNEFSVGISRDRWHELTSGGENPLLDRAIQGVYPPGSTFKVVTMLAALRAGVAEPETRLNPCPGHYYFGNRTFMCWKHEGHGSLDFVGALQHSCDVYFYQIGPKLGLDRLEETAHDLGLGNRTGIDLPQEKRGLVPTKSWYDKRWGAKGWRPGLMLNLAIGQGELLVTPLQLAMMLSEVAMNGLAIQPHVVKEVRGVGVSSREREPRPRLRLDDRIWDAVHAGLSAAVEAGTGTAARVPGIHVAGKTGTAQNPHGEDHALFVCYAPAEQPTIALAFVIENGGHGGSACAPRAGQVLRTLFMPDTLRAPPTASVPARIDTTGVARDAD